MTLLNTLRRRVALIICPELDYDEVGPSSDQAEIFEIRVLNGSIWQEAQLVNGKLHWIIPSIDKSEEARLRELCKVYARANQKVPNAIAQVLLQAERRSFERELRPFAQVPRGGDLNAVSTTVCCQPPQSVPQGAY